MERGPAGGVEPDATERGTPHMRNIFYIIGVVVVVVLIVSFVL